MEPIFLTGKSSISASCSIALLNYKEVLRTLLFLFTKELSKSGDLTMKAWVHFCEWWMPVPLRQFTEVVFP
jgi:hypothetical protein